MEHFFIKMVIFIKEIGLEIKNQEKENYQIISNKLTTKEIGKMVKNIYIY